MAIVKTQLVIDGKNNSRKAFEEVNSQLDTMNKRLASSGKAIVGLFSAALVTGAAKALGGLADESKQLEARLSLAYGTQKEFNSALADVRRIADENGASLQSVTDLYTRLTPALKGAGRSQVEVGQVTEAVTKALRISGASAAESSAAITQFGQALGAGALRGEEFNSIAEQAPRLMQALADSLGVPVGKLREMAAAGQLTAEVVTDALIQQLPKLKVEFEKLGDTFGTAGERLNNAAVEMVGAFDKMTGASSKATKGMNDLAAAMNKVATGEFLDLFRDEKQTAGGLNTEISLMIYQLRELNSLRDKLNNGSWFERLALQLRGVSADSINQDEARVKAQIEALRSQLRAQFGGASEERDEDLASRRKYVSEIEGEQRRLVSAAEAAGESLLAEEKKVNSELERIKQDRLGIEQRYAEAIAKFRSGGQGGASFGQYQDLKIAAQRSLNAGDVQAAQRQAQAALKVLEDLQAAGESTYGFEGLAKGLQAIENAAKDLEQRRAEQKLADLKQEMINIKSAAAELEDMPVSVQMDDAKLAEVQAKLDALAKREIIVKVGAQYDFENEYTLQDPGPAPQKFATGGLIRGPGTGTSDSIPALLSNGEYVIRAAAVRKLGKNALDMLNRGIPIPRFADGGMVGTVASLDTAASGPSRGVVNLTLPGGETYTMLAEADQFDRLLSNTARKFGRTHRGP
ncbi:MAG: tape measure protein [Pseudomonas sp.]|nr:MAG: tape measure protein [Pseudomonas sp.]